MTQQSSKGGQRDTATTGTQAGQGAGRDVADQAKQAAGQVATQAQQAAGQVADQAREQVSSRLSGQKDRAAEGLSSMAQALRHTGQQLRQQDQMGRTSYIDRAASQVERLSSYIQNNDLGALVDDVEQLARRQPAMFLGGAFVLGLLGARFLKSSRPYTETSYAGRTALARRQASYATSYANQAGFRGVGTGPRYSSGMQSGMSTTTAGQAGAQPRTSTTGRTTTGKSSNAGAGPRLYDERSEE